MEVPEYPSNSIKNRNVGVEQPGTEKMVTDISNVKPESVATGKTSLKKLPLSKRFVKTFLAEDITDVKNYIVQDVLIPSIIDGMYDVATSALGALFYGSGSKVGPPHKRKGGGKVPYNSLYSGKYPGTKTTPANRSDNEYVSFESRVDAEQCLYEMRKTIKDYGAVTVAFYKEAGNVSSVFTDNKYGWGPGDLDSVPIRRVGKEYMLELPDPTELD